MSVVFGKHMIECNLQLVLIVESLLFTLMESFQPRFLVSVHGVNMVERL